MRKWIFNNKPKAGGVRTEHGKPMRDGLSYHTFLWRWWWHRWATEEQHVCPHNQACDLTERRRTYSPWYVQVENLLPLCCQSTFCLKSKSRERPVILKGYHMIQTQYNTNAFIYSSFITLAIYYNVKNDNKHWTISVLWSLGHTGDSQ